MTRRAESSDVSIAQQKALSRHRQRRRDAGVVRIEVQAPAIDAPILRDLAAALRESSRDGQSLRDQLRSIVAKPRAQSAFDIFGSDLPDAYFEGVFDDAGRCDLPRDVDL